jgi:hypothetical protein
MPSRVRASLRALRTPRPATTFCVYGGAGCGSAGVSRSLRCYQVSVIFPRHSRSPTHHACGRAAEGSSQNQGRRPVRKSKNQISATTIAIATMAASRPFGVFCSVIASDYGGRGPQIASQWSNVTTECRPLHHGTSKNLAWPCAIASSGSHVGSDKVQLPN